VIVIFVMYEELRFGFAYNMEKTEMRISFKTEKKVCHNFSFFFALTML
jgi:hypothetical protein